MSKRHELRREQRQQRKFGVPLTFAEVDDLNAQRRLPADHPTSGKNYAILSPPELALRALGVIERSGLIPYLERRLRSHPGRRSELSISVMLLLMVLAAFTNYTYRRSDLAAVIAGLDARIAFKLGLCDRATRNTIGYGVTATQCRRLEQALDDGWVDKDDGTVCDANWFTHCLIKGSIPTEIAEQVTAGATDSTFVEPWANPSPYADGTTRPDGPLSADKDAAFGFRGGVGKRKSGVAFGFDVHALVAVRETNWTGRPSSANLGEPVTPAILHLKLEPASSDAATVGVEVFDRAKKVAPNLNEVAADRGFSEKGKRFNRELHNKSVDVVMDYKRTGPKRCAR